jgi:dihydroorotate dehydrogenase (NAD+) catalytic subunit
MVYDLVGALKIPVVGIGGVTSTRDALEFLLAGAKAVQVGTASFQDPAAGRRIADGIAAYCEKHQISVEELIGKARV